MCVVCHVVLLYSVVDIVVDVVVISGDMFCLVIYVTLWCVCV